MLGIVVLNYNNWEATTACLESVPAAACGIDYAIFLVDNASPVRPPDDLLARLQSDGARVILNTMNSGYAAGNNLGAGSAIAAGSSQILIANSDLVFPAGSIRNLVEMLDKKPGVAILGPRLLDATGEPAGIVLPNAVGLGDMYLRHSALRHLAVMRSRPSETPDESSAVFAVSGACFLVAADAVHHVFPLDPATFLYGEERILGRKMQAKGLLTEYITAIVVEHSGGASTDGVRPLAFAASVHSRLYYCRVHLQAPLWKILPLAVIHCFAFAARGLVDSRYRAPSKPFFLAVWRGITGSAFLADSDSVVGDDQVQSIIPEGPRR